MALNRKSSGLPSSTSSRSKQTTLFQNWNVGQNVAQNQDALNELDDQLDEETLLAACVEWEMEETGTNQTTHPHPPQATPLEDLPGFDVSAGNIYIYPTNYPLRDYQFNIVQQALFKNTMVTLPTGLGKTFIAAVVMYNFYRWYPRGKVVFMAPTKPLVFQQIEACFNIMGIPQEDMAEMTGNMHPPERKKSWQRQRVFFLTPQVMTNDLSRRACPADDIKCVVVDEAHKALGNQAYCQVIRELSKYTSQFRVLALSATPGGDIKAVNEVLSNLLISHIEIRSEDSLDIRQYVHERKVEKIVVPIGDELKQVKEQYLQIINVFVNRLVRCRVLFSRDPETLTKFQILKSREAFRQDPPPEITAARRGPVEGDFAICMSLYHGFELLLQHGQRSLYSFLLSTVDGSKGNARTRSELQRNPDFSNLMELLEGKYAGSMHHQNTSHNASHNSSHNSSGLFTSMSSPSLRAKGSKVVGGCKEEEEEYLPSHPKMTKLKEVVLEHFNKFTSANKADAGPSTSKAPQASTRVMIFAQYRDSVQEITDMLNHHWPSIRCMSFIGQASAGKNTKGFSQKEQIRVVNEFKNGGYNTLVSTCVGEEGLDIGDVDLIVCFDAHKSPIRLVQRMGRTGRKREGRIIMLVTEGKEAAIYDRSQYSKKGIHRALQGNSKSLHLYPCSPRMVPRGLNPAAHKMNIKVGEYRSKHKTKAAAAAASTTSSKRKSSMNVGDISRFMQGTKPDPAEDVFLTYEELAFWNLHYKVDQGEQRKAPQTTKFLSFNKKAVEEVSVPDEKELSLNAFAEWQTNKQPTHKVSHSRQCDIFVEMMEFFEIQGHTEDEDIYGAEMALYLDERDVLRPKEKKAGKEGILRYCSQEGKKNDKKDVAILDEEGDFNRKDVPSKSKKGVKGKKKGSKSKSMPSEPDHLGSDDDLPVVDLFSEPSKKQDENSERTGKHKSKGSKSRKSSDDGSSSDGKAKKSRKKSKSPHEEKDSRAKRKSIPLPCDSDEDDFDTDRRSVTPPRPFGASHTADLQLPKSHDMEDQVTESDQNGLQDEPMDTGSDDDQAVLPIKPGAASTSSPSKNHQEGSRSDTSLNTSDIFLSCSQVFKAPEVSSTLGATRKEKTTSESTRDDGKDDLMPPPPPSLSGLDLLDDIDLSFNASQLARDDTWQRISPKKKPLKHDIAFVSGEPDISPSFRMSDKGITELEGEAEKQNNRTRSISSEKLHGTIENEATDDFSSDLTHTRTDVIGAEFRDVVADSDEIVAEEKLNIYKSAIDDTEIVDEVQTNITDIKKGFVHPGETDHSKPSLLGNHKIEAHTKMEEKSILHHALDDNGDEDDAKNITDELVQAWDNFEGDIFDDDDEDNMDPDHGHESNTLDKSPVVSGKAILDAGRKQDVKNSSLAFKPLVADSEGTDQKVSAGLKVSTASDSIKASTYSGPSNWKLSHDTKQSKEMLQRMKTSVEGEEDTRSTTIYTPVKGNNLFKSQQEPEHESTAENEVNPTQQPRFDLDFDFGDFFDMDDEAFDEIGIVPPSPQVNQKRSGFMAMSQVSQSSIRPEVSARNHNTATTLSVKHEITERPKLKPQGDQCYQIQVSPSREAATFDNKNLVKHPVLDQSKSSKVEGKNSSLSRFKRNLMQSVKPNDLQETHSMSQKSKGQASPESDVKPCMDTVKKMDKPPAASTPVLPNTNREGLRHQGNDVSPIEQSAQGDIKQYDTPSSHLQKAHPKDLRKRLSIKRKDGVAPRQGSVSTVQKQSSRPTPILPGKRKSSPLIEEGQFEDTSVSNPLKKSKTSSEQDIGLSAGSKEVYSMKPVVENGFGKMAEKDDIDSLLEDLDWEDSLVADATLTKSGKQNSGLESKRDSTGITTPKTGTISDDDDDDDSEEVIGRVKKKRRAVILVSPDTPQTFKTPLRASVAVTPVSFKKKPVHIVSDDDSDDTSFIVQPKKRKAKKILDMSSSIIIPDGVQDDDFEAPVKQIVAVKTKKIHREHGRDDIPLKQRLEMKERNKLKKSTKNYRHAAAHFLDEEAEVSEDEECSSDEENSDLDNSLEGFINNASQCSQTTCPQDMHAIYMKSVRSPSVAGPSNRFKMVHRHSPDLNVFSQVPKQDASYMEDSFVVQGGEEDDDAAEMDEDISLVAMDNTINLDNIIDAGSRRKGGRRLRNKGGESKAARILRAGRAAVLKSDSSLSDVEEAAEEDDLMDWEMDFEKSRKTNQRKQQSNWGSSAKGRLLGNNRRLEKANMNSKIVSSKPQDSDRISKPKTDTQPFKISTKEAHAFNEKEKSPLKTNYALMNSGRISEAAVPSDRPVSKPCTFVAPQPAAPIISSSLVSPKTLAQREREERLRRQKQKQAEFLEKLQKKQAQTSSQASDISPVKKTSLSSWSHRKEEGINEKTTAIHKQSSASSSGYSNPRRDFPNSEGFEVPRSSGQSSSSMNSGSTSKVESSSSMNQNSVSRVVSSTPRASASNKIINTLTMMDNSVVNATMSATAVNSSVLSAKSLISASQASPLVILVDSKELSSAPHMVSTLTITYGLNPIVSQLQGCDYVTSTRMGVEKRTLSEFANSSNRQKVLDRVRHMCELFDRPCLIIEKDREKNRDKRQPPKTLIRTKYLDATLAALTKTHVKILFSDSTEETAQILADLAKIENRKGAAIPTIQDMDSMTEQVLKFYQSIPGVSYVTALSLLQHYPSVKELLSTCESILQSRIKVSSVRAKQIMTYINHHFDEQMTGSR